MSSSKSIWSRIFGLSSIFSHSARSSGDGAAAAISGIAAPAEAEAPEEHETGDGAALDEVPRDICAAFRGVTVSKASGGVDGESVVAPVADAAVVSFLESTEDVDTGTTASAELVTSEIDGPAHAEETQELLEAVTAADTTSGDVVHEVATDAAADDETSASVITLAPPIEQTVANDIDFVDVVEIRQTATLSERLHEVALLNTRKRGKPALARAGRMAKQRPAAGLLGAANRKTARVSVGASTWPVYTGRARGLTTPAVNRPTRATSGGALIVPLAPKAKPCKLSGATTGGRGLRRAA